MERARHCHYATISPSYIYSCSLAMAAHCYSIQKPSSPPRSWSRDARKRASLNTTGASLSRRARSSIASHSIKIDKIKSPWKRKRKEAIFDSVSVDILDEQPLERWESSTGGTAVCKTSGDSERVDDGAFLSVQDTHRRLASFLFRFLLNGPSEPQVLHFIFACLGGQTIYIVKSRENSWNAEPEGEKWKVRLSVRSLANSVVLTILAISLN